MSRLIVSGTQLESCATENMCVYQQLGKLSATLDIKFYLIFKFAFIQWQISDLYDTKCRLIFGLRMSFRLWLLDIKLYI
jgi:hypothetical protein